MDAARAQYQQTQEQLQKTRSRVQTAARNLGFQQSNEAARPATPPEKFVLVRAPAAGTIRVIGVRVGQQVLRAQPLATLSVRQ